MRRRPAGTPLILTQRTPRGVMVSATDDPEECSICLKTATTGCSEPLVRGHEVHRGCLQERVNMSPPPETRARDPLCRQMTGPVRPEMNKFTQQSYTYGGFSTQGPHGGRVPILTPPAGGLRRYCSPRGEGVEEPPGSRTNLGLLIHMG